MKYLKIFMLISMLSFQGNAQEKEVLSIPQFKAEPYEGMDAFYKNFISKLNLNKKNDKDILVLLQFVVDTDGSFTDIHIKKDEFGLGKDVIRTLISMPKWKPAHSKGKPVRSRFNIPIKIEGDNRQDLNETIFDEKLENKEMETSFFKFNCNCIATDQQVDETGIKHEFEYLTNTGMYKLVVLKADEIKFEQFKNYQKDFLDSRKIEIDQVEYLGVNSFNYEETLDIEQNVFYTKNRFFFKEDLVYMLFYMSKEKSETEHTFSEFLESFQTKQ